MSQIAHKLRSATISWPSKFKEAPRAGIGCALLHVWGAETHKKKS